VPPIIRKPTKPISEPSVTVDIQYEEDTTTGDVRIVDRSSPPKINRGSKKPVPYRGTFDVRLVFGEGKNAYQTSQKYEGTIVGPFGVAKVHGEWTVTLIAVKRKTATEVPVKSHAGGVALALALSHLPWHEYKVDEHGRRIETAASKKLEADYLKILNSRKEWA